MKRPACHSILALCLWALVTSTLIGCGRTASHPSRSSSATSGAADDDEPITPDSWAHADLPKLDLRKTPDPQAPAHAGEARAIAALAGLLESKPKFPHYKVLWGLIFGEESTALCAIQFHPAEGRLEFVRGNYQHTDQYQYLGVTRDKIQQLNRRRLPIVDDLIRLGCRRQ